MPAAPPIPADRIVVLMPNWLGDAVMATPFLRALRQLYPTAHIAAAARPLVAPVLAGLPFINQSHIHTKAQDPAPWLRQNRFDLGILLPNSFRAAWSLFRGRVKHRLGYARGNRSLLLTHRLHPIPRTPEQRTKDRLKQRAIRSLGGPNIAIGSPFQPLPTIDYYLALATHLGSSSPARHMELAITPDERHEADAILHSLGNPQHLITIVPGANFGSSKCWPPDRFAALADRLLDSATGASAPLHILLAGSPAEIPIIDAIIKASHHPQNLHALPKLRPTGNSGQGPTFGALKDLIRRSRLVLCNDTGPRHFAAAFNIPTVTLFGPTDPTWADTFAHNERIVRIDVPCGPCQLKKCPIDHRCMQGLTVERAQHAITDLFPATPFAALTPTTPTTAIGGGGNG